jgi:hypothetical protein
MAPNRSDTHNAQWKKRFPYWSWLWALTHIHWDKYSMYSWMDRVIFCISHNLHFRSNCPGVIELNRSQCVMYLQTTRVELQWRSFLWMTRLFVHSGIQSNMNLARFEWHYFLNCACFVTNCSWYLNFLIYVNVISGCASLALHIWSSIEWQAFFKWSNECTVCNNGSREIGK